MQRAKIYANDVLDSMDVRLAQFIVWSSYVFFFIVLIYFFMFAEVVACIADNSKPVESCRDNVAGQMTYYFINKIIK